MTPLHWIVGPSTDRSSITIWAIMRGVPLACPSLPAVAAEFGQCVRFLDLFPDWRARLPEVAQVYPDWRALVDQWASLETLYREDLTSLAARPLRVSRRLRPSGLIRSFMLCRLTPECVMSSLLLALASRRTLFVWMIRRLS